MKLEKSFDGLKVVDFSQGVAGPMCGLHLAQYGADVLKIEPLGMGEWGRSLGPRYGDFSALAVALNRGKRSLAVDLKNPKGKDIVLKLIEDADVVMENYRAGVMERLGFDETAVREINPNVIYLTIEGFGKDGPYRDRPATDSVLQGYAGFMDINRDADGTPKMMLPYLIDYVTGLYAFQAVSAALYKQAKKGAGETIRLSLLQSAAALQATKMIDAQVEKGAKVSGGVPMGTFQTKDGFMSMNARRQNQFAALCKLIKREDLIDDPRYATVTARFKNEKEIMDIVISAMKERTTAEWTKLLIDADILNAPVNSYEDFYKELHVQAVKTFTWLDHDDLGRIPMPRIPALSPVVAGDAMSESPHVGEHSHAVLKDLGYAASEISMFCEEGVIGAYTPDKD
jgi:crotonobetainyl-CoA:carnitine CoA-transferase CaiB-like acyl-CoA transferase